MKQLILTSFINEFASITGWSVSDLIGGSRKHNRKKVQYSLVDVRHIIYYTVIEKSELGWTDLSKIMCRHHTTIIYGVRRIAEQRFLYDNLSELCILAEDLLNKIQKVKTLNNPCFVPHLGFVNAMDVIKKNERYIRLMYEKKRAIKKKVA